MTRETPQRDIERLRWAKVHANAFRNIDPFADFRPCDACGQRGPTVVLWRLAPRALWTSAPPAAGRRFVCADGCAEGIAELNSYGVGAADPMTLLSEAYPPRPQQFWEPS